MCNAEIATRDTFAMTPVEIASLSDTPAKLLALAIANQTPPETLAKLMDLQERWEKNTARKEYVAAMSEFKKSAPPAILKHSKVDFTTGKGRTNYNYANLGDVTTQVTPLLAKHGLHAAWETAMPQNGPISVTCHITHSAGHRESVTLSGPADMSGNKNAMQAIGSAVTYLQRYTLLAALGLATMEDDDGRGGKDQQADATPGKSEFQIAAEDAWNNIGKLKWLLEQGAKNGEPDADLTAIKARIAVLTPAPQENKPATQTKPAEQAAPQTAPAARQQTQQPSPQTAPASKAPSWNGGPDEKTAYTLAKVPTADGTLLATMQKIVTETMVGQENYRKIMAAFTAREKELYPPQPEVDTDPFARDVPPEIQGLTMMLESKSTAADFDDVAKRWSEDSHSISEPTYNAGVVLIQQARVSKGV